MDIAHSTALVTGANRGIGRIVVEQLLERGARRVYATARRPESLPFTDPRVVPLRLDVTDGAHAASAAEQAGDVDLIVNNAGIASAQNLLTGDLERIRAEMETNFFGALHVSREFAPVLAAHGGGAIINIMSLLSFRTFPGNGSYAASKAAEWQLTNSTRLELAAQGTQVLGVHLASTDTDMMAGWDIPKNDPRQVVAMFLDALEAGRSEVLDTDTAAIKARLASTPEELYAELG
ncbi:SDR family oxidoreductase [Brachybacterium halotolerans subsp. kimchii]|uniref:SDR family oxidoreductase n=1 Tax=Brachybacterium halotolerans TaxID=2795215 RepID=UPI001E40EB1A|nr:SDR family oxidoreductase [Brachybacterium halotolerans]UEJ82822.1 SDR family oxidoreductase [Brachybacterium halotolerans subsp. kimchii]